MIFHQCRNRSGNSSTMTGQLGLQMENRGRWVMLLKPRFKPFSSLVMRMQEALISPCPRQLGEMVPTALGDASRNYLNGDFTSAPGFAVRDTPSPSRSLPPPAARTVHLLRQAQLDSFSPWLGLGWPGRHSCACGPSASSATCTASGRFLRAGPAEMDQHLVNPPFADDLSHLKMGSPAENHPRRV